MWAYLFRQSVSLILGHPHQLLTKCIDPPLHGGFLLVDHHFIVVAFFVEIDEVGRGPMSLCGTVSHIVSHLATFKAGVVSSVRGCLGDATSCHSSLLSPAIWGSRMAEVHWDRLVIEHWWGIGRVYWGCPVSDQIMVSSGVGWRPTPHSLLGALKEGWGQLSSLQSCVPPISSVWSSGVALGSKHILNDLAGPGHIDCLLLHLFIACWKGGFHDFSGNGLGEASKEEVGTLVVSCGVVCKVKQLFKRGDIGVDIRPFHSVVVK